MDILQKASEFESRKWSGITTSERIKASRDLKQLILDINAVYKRNRDQSLMDLMKRLTVIKRKLEARLNGGLQI